MTQPAPEFQIIVILLAAVNELQEQVAKLQAENKELSGRLNTNSRNSSKPPSTDGYAKPSAKEKDSSDSPPESDLKDDKPNPKSLRQKSDQKPGGQKGHKGVTLKQVAEAEHTQYHPVTECENCRQPLHSAKIIKLIERQVFEPGHFGYFEVTSHVAEVKQCSGSFPLKGWRYFYSTKVSIKELILAQRRVKNLHFKHDIMHNKDTLYAKNIISSAPPSLQPLSGK